MQKPTRLSLTLGILLCLAACGGGSSSNNTPPPPPAPTIVDAQFDLAAFQVPGGGSATGTANAELSVNLDDGTVTGTVTLNGLTAIEVRLSEGFAGQLGTLIAALADDGNGTWSIPSGTTLSVNQRDLLDQGGIFIEVTTAEFPEGALRAQILLGNQQVFVNIVGGGQEIPPVDSSATGFAGMTFDPDSGSAIVHVTVTGLADAVAAHVHQAFAGTNGGIVIELEQDPNDVNHWRTPTGTILDAAGADALTAGELYVNVHTPAHPGGEVRGQIVGADIELIFVSLDGGQEAPPVDTAATANAGITLNRASGALQLHMTAFGLNDAVAAHIHDAFAGSNGPVDIELTQDPNNAAHWLTPDGTTLDADQLAKLDTARWYVNLHTPGNPGGEVRGQIVPAGFEVIIAPMSGDQEVPALASAAFGVAGLTLDQATSTIELHVTGAGVDDAVAAHIHQGFAGANGGVIIELEQDPNDVAHWLAPTATVLDAAARSALDNGELYVNVHTPANPGGEIRGQLVPDNVDLITFPLTGAQSVPAVTSTGSAAAAVTINRDTQAVAANINAVGLDDAVAAHIHSGLAGDTGPVEIEFVQDATDVTHWTLADTLTENQTMFLAEGALYVNLHTPANPAGGSTRANRTRRYRSCIHDAEPGGCGAAQPIGRHGHRRHHHRDCFAPDQYQHEPVGAGRRQQRASAPGTTHAERAGNFHPDPGCHGNYPLAPCRPGVGRQRLPGVAQPGFVRASSHHRPTRRRGARATGAGRVEPVTRRSLYRSVHPARQRVVGRGAPKRCDRIQPHAPCHQHQLCPVYAAGQRRRRRFRQRQ